MRRLLIVMFLNVLGVHAGAQVEDFNDGDLSGWGASADYYLTNAGTELRIESYKTSTWNSFTYSFPKTDISSNPYVSLKVKTNIDFNLNFFINSDQAYGNGGKYQEIIHSDDFTEYVFDFSNAPVAYLQNANFLNFVFNPGASRGCISTVYFDDIRIGADAKVMPKVVGIQDQYHAINADSVHVPLWRVEDLFDGSEPITIKVTSSNTDLISTPSVIYNNVKGEGFLSYKPASDKMGQSIITLIVSGNCPEDNIQSFRVLVESNLAPLIDQVEDVNILSGEQKEIIITGLDDGNPNANQSVSVYAESSNKALIPNPQVVSHDMNFSASLVCNPTPGMTGVTTIRVLVKDNGGVLEGGVDSSIMNFEIRVYEELNNPPTIEIPEDISLFQDGGIQTVSLKKISDGDEDWEQSVEISAVSSDPSVLADPVVVYSLGKETADLLLETEEGKFGSATITITLTDDGGNSKNGGNATNRYSFDVEIRPRPYTGWEDDFEDGILGSQWPAAWGDPGENSHLCSESGGAMTIQIDKTRSNNRWAGLWFNIEEETDLSKNPFISIRMKTDHPGTEMLIFLWDANDHYNTNKTVRHTVTGDYVEYYFDYSDPSYQLQSDGTQVDISRIKALLINFDPGVSSPLFRGNFYFEDFRIGDKALTISETPVVTMDNIPDFAMPMGAGMQNILITGLTNGLDDTSEVYVSAVSNNTSLIPNPEISDVSQQSAVLSFAPVQSKTGKATITVVATANGSQAVTQTFDIDVLLLNEQSAADLVIDLQTKYQEIDGFGAFMGSGDKYSQDIIELAREMGMSMARFGVIGGGFELINDNSDPYITNLQAFDQTALSIENMRRLAPYIDKFIVSFWSPAGWMKTNKWEDGVDNWASDNKLEPRYYQEYAEEVVALCRIVRRETGKDIYAIGLQNEPQFNEPYPSCQVNWNEFRDLINVVGPRLEQEGLGNVKLFWAEALPAQSSIDEYILAVKNDATAHQYADIVAIHNYDADGISVGGAGCNEWQSIYNMAQTPPGIYKTWMTETSGHSNTWEGAMTLAGNIFNALNCGNASAWVFWSFAVPETSSQFGLVVANQPTSRYYISKQYYKFIRPGAVRIGIESSSIPALAFKDETNEIVTIVLFNNTDQSKAVELKGDGLPSTWKKYVTSESRNFEQGDDISSDGLLVVPPSSLTTLVGSDHFTSSQIDVPDNKGKEDRIYLYPNPARRILNISFPENRFDRLLISDITGRVILTETIPLDKVLMKINVSEMEAGLYFLLLENEKKSISQRFIVGPK